MKMPICLEALNDLQHAWVNAPHAIASERLLRNDVTLEANEFERNATLADIALCGMRCRAGSDLASFSSAQVSMLSVCNPTTLPESSLIVEATKQRLRSGRRAQLQQERGQIRLNNQQ
jgi:hypothetical protein